MIGPDSVFEGTIVVRRAISIDGSFKGRIESKGSVIVGKSGVVEADVVANRVVVNGELKGDVHASELLDIGDSGVVRGDVETRHLIVASGGRLEGFCHTITEGQGQISGPHISQPAPSAYGGRDDPEVHGRADERDLLLMDHEEVGD